MSTLAARFEDVLGRIGAVFGDSGKLTGTLERRTRKSGSTSYDPTFDREHYTCTCLWDEFTFMERAGGGIGDRDSVILIGADPGPRSESGKSTAPKPGDRLTVSDETYEIRAVETVRPAGTALLYRARLRA